MSHDIYGYNKAEEFIAHARFTMGNMSVIILYNLFDAEEYNGGVSGIGHVSTYTLQEIEDIMENFKKRYKNYTTFIQDDDPKYFDQRQIFRFIQDCLETAQAEGSVEVAFA